MVSSSCSLGSLEKNSKAWAFEELVEYIDTSLEEGVQTFQLAELHAVYHFNMKKESAVVKNSRHSVDREPPLPVYIGLNSHSTFYLHE